MPALAAGAKRTYLRTRYTTSPRIEPLQTMAAATAEQQVAVGGRVALPPTYGPVETYLRYALAGATCATTAHTVLVPMDVVKTRLQVRFAVCFSTLADAPSVLTWTRTWRPSRSVGQSNPGKYTGMADGFKQIARAEGAGALLLGLGPTFVRGLRAPPPRVTALPVLTLSALYALVTGAAAVGLRGAGRLQVWLF